jgi:hypothetical protein
MSPPTVLTLLTEEQLRAIVFAAVREAMGVAAEREECFDTKGAAVYLKTTVAALHMQVQRGVLKPDARGGRGRFRGHRFSKATLDAFVSRGGR